MLDITILAVGKLKAPYWQAAADEYLKRLKPYARIKIEELKPEPFSGATKEKSIAAETERMANYLKRREGAAVFLLSEGGEAMTSPRLAAALKKIFRPVIFVIGGALGFSADFKNRYPRLALSPLTFPHELARVILLEQLYRAAAIINEKDYHY